MHYTTKAIKVIELNMLNARVPQQCDIMECGHNIKGLLCKCWVDNDTAYFKIAHFDGSVVDYSAHFDVLSIQQLIHGEYLVAALRLWSMEITDADETGKRETNCVREGEVDWQGDSDST